MSGWVSFAVFLAIIGILLGAYMGTGGIDTEAQVHMDRLSSFQVTSEDTGTSVGAIEFAKSSFEYLDSLFWMSTYWIRENPIAQDYPYFFWGFAALVTIPFAVKVLEMFVGIFQR